MRWVKKERLVKEKENENENEVVEICGWTFLVKSIYILDIELE